MGSTGWFVLAIANLWKTLSAIIKVKLEHYAMTKHNVSTFCAVEEDKRLIRFYSPINQIKVNKLVQISTKQTSKTD